MRYLERHDLMGKHLLTTDAAAGYVILEDWPQQKVFIDDRYDMYPTSVIYDYFDLTGAKPGGRGCSTSTTSTSSCGARTPRSASLLDKSRRVAAGATATPPTRSGCARVTVRYGRCSSGQEPVDDREHGPGEDMRGRS